MVISKSGIHCLFELHIICLPPPPVYSQQCVRAGCALVCLNLLGVFFSVGCVCFSFKKVLFPNTLFYERNALKKSFQSHPGLIFNITGMCLVIVIVKWWRCSALQLCTCLISYFPTWQKMGRAQKACNQCPVENPLDVILFLIKTPKFMSLSVNLLSKLPLHQQRSTMNSLAGAIWDTLAFRGLPRVYSMDYLHPSRATTGGPSGLPIVSKMMFNTTHLGDLSVEPKGQLRWSAARS